MAKKEILVCSQAARRHGVMAAPLGLWTQFMASRCNNASAALNKELCALQYLHVIMLLYTIILCNINLHMIAQFLVCRNSRNVC